MASLQRFSSHGQIYWRIVESYRKNGRPTVRVLMHLGKAEQLMARLSGAEQGLSIHSLSVGAVDTLFALAQTFDIAGEIDRAIVACGGKGRMRDGLSVGQTILAGAIGRLCHPCSKRAFAAWAKGTTLPERMGFQAEALSSQHFWDQMDALPAEAIRRAEEAIVARVVNAEALGGGLLAYDTTNFFTYIASSNARSRLAQRGRNKQHRHDLRQLGLALVVSEEGQVPLSHVLYEGRRPDVKSFPEIIAPLRKKLRTLLASAGQLTLVFDQGQESKDNLSGLRGGEEPAHYVTALKPSHHRAWLAEAAQRLENVVLSSGKPVRAYRARRAVHGVEHTVVAVFSQRLCDGQRRGLEQALQKALGQIARISPHPKEGIAGARRQVARIRGRQYLRQVLTCELAEEDGRVVITPKVDAAARRHLETGYFGLRVLATTRDEWTTAQIIEAYRGQSRAERAFRDLKDPWVCAFRPQYHWTDQKLLVHAFMAFLSLLLGRLLLKRAQQHAGFTGSLRSLVQQLTQLRRATVICAPQGRGRPRVNHQLEAAEESVTNLARALGVNA